MLLSDRQMHIIHSLLNLVEAYIKEIANFRSDS